MTTMVVFYINVSLIFIKIVVKLYSSFYNQFNTTFCRSVQLKITIDKTKKSDKVIYAFNLQLPEEITPSESSLDVVGDGKVKLKLKKVQSGSWETYEEEMFPTANIGSD